MAPGDIEVRGNRRELFLNIGLFFFCFCESALWEAILYLNRPSVL